MALRIESAGKTDVGLVREKNEDAMLIDPRLGLYVVCDGMGGHVGGQVASQLAVATMAERLTTSGRRRGAPPASRQIVRSWRAAGPAGRAASTRGSRGARPLGRP